MANRDRSLVQAVELWVPQGEVIAFAAGAYRYHYELLAHSAGLSFQYGEGLPGAVWANQKAVVWTELAGRFERAELAASAGIDAVLGCPLFDGKRLVGVLNLLLTQRSEAPSCLEVWNVSEELDVLQHGGGYYVHCSELERFSPYIQFQRGTGLPGLTWLAGDVQIMQDVRRSNAFVRAGLAARGGLKNGIGIPVYRERRVAQVLALFGAEAQSFILSAELYHPQGKELGAAMLFDWSGRGSPSGESSADAPGRSLARQVLSTQSPALAEAKSSPATEISLALPIYDKKGLKQILVLRF
jgi:hypothetical protein